MANVSAADVKRLRELTGAGMLDCKNALADNDADFDKAVEALRIKGAKDVGKRAERATAEGLVAAKNGALIDTVDLGALGAGQHAFDWNANGLDPSAVAGFSIRATTGGQPIAATPLARLPVTSVSFSSGAMSLQLQDGRNLAYDQVRAFM